MVTNRQKILFARFFSVILISIVLLTFFTSFASAQGVDVPQVKDKTFVYDMENVIDSKQEDYINNLLRFLEEKTSVEFAVITTLSFNNLTIEDYAHDLFNKLEIGKSDKDNGVLFLISVKEGHARLEIGYGLESLLTDGLCGQILDKYYVPNRDQGHYLDSITQTVNGVLAVLGKEFGVEIVQNQEEIVKSINTKDTWSVVWKIVIIALIIIVAVMLEVYTDGSSSSGGRYYGGGGFSSGGSFGGGHSGGGGASR